MKQNPMKRHTADEILLKLYQAEHLAASGQNQTEICKALNVSVMTLHRWRKLQDHVSTTSGANAGLAAASVDVANVSGPGKPSVFPSLSDLVDENRRLRKIVTDLLLEKIKLEEASQSRASRAMDKRLSEPLRS